MALATSPTLTPSSPVTMPAAPAVSPRALELIQALVRMNTVSDNSNLELIHFVRDELARLGVASRITTWPSPSLWRWGPACRHCGS